MLGSALALIVAGWLALRFPRFDLINNFLPILTGIAVAALLVIVARSGWSIRFTIAVAVLLAGSVPRFLTQGSASVIGKTPGRPLKLIQFNVFKDNATPAAAAQWVLRQEPDVVTMEETLGSSRVVLRLLRPYYPYQTSCLSRMRCSTVILSRQRPIASGGLAHGDPENQKTLSATWATFSHVGGPFTVVAVHMVRPWPWGNQEPARQQLAAYLQGIKRDRVIVAGDFNLTPWTEAMRHQDRLFGIPRYTRTLATWPAMIDGRQTLPVMPIDHVYAGRSWKVESIQRGPYLGSDHRPVLVSLALADSPAATSSIN